MQVPIIQIGNSKGILLSKTILGKYHIADSVELIMEEDVIVIKPYLHPRKGWEDAFNKMHDCGEDNPFMQDVYEEESFEEWK